MGLVTPGLGLIVWMTIAFLVVLFVLTKFAWKPILNSLKEREDSIDNALKAADQAREEMAKMQADNEKILKEANEERNKILKEPKISVTSWSTMPRKKPRQKRIRSWKMPSARSTTRRWPL